MEVLYYISDCMIPFVILYLVGYGMCKKVDIFDSFIEGAKDGFLTVYKILPTLIGLMIGVGILRQSGFMEWLAGIFAPVVNILHFPGELLPLFIVKMFSSSAATGLLLDIYKTYELFGNHFLYHERLFYDGARDQNALYTYRCIGGNFCRGDGGGFAGGNVVKKFLTFATFSSYHSLYKYKVHD